MYWSVSQTEAAGKPALMKPQDSSYDPSKLPPKSPFKLPSQKQQQHEKKKYLHPGHTCPQKDFIFKHTCLDCGTTEDAFNAKRDKGFGNREEHHLLNVDKRGVTYYATEERACYNHPSQYFKCSSQFCTIEGDECTAGHSTFNGHYWEKTLACCPHRRFLTDHHCKHCRNSTDVQEWLKKHHGSSWVYTGDLSFERVQQKGIQQPDVCVNMYAPLYQCDQFEQCSLVGKQCTTKHKISNGAPLSIPSDFQVYFECLPEPDELEDDELAVEGAVGGDLTWQELPEELQQLIWLEQVTPAKEDQPAHTEETAKTKTKENIKSHLRFEQDQQETDQK